jgi:hypothetical protein
MAKITLNEKQTQFIATLVSTGEHSVDYFEAIQFAIESWYLGLPNAEEDPIYCEFREYFMKKVANVGSGWNNSYKYNDARYSTILCDYIEVFYNEVVNDKYKGIKAFTYGFLDEYHCKKDGAEKYNQHDWECSFDEYCFDMADTISTCLIEQYSKEELFTWGFWKHWDEQDDSDRYSSKRPATKRPAKKAATKKK